MTTPTQHPPCTGCDDPTCPRRRVMSRDDFDSHMAVVENANKARARNAAPQLCPYEHVTDASFSSLLRSRDEARTEVEILQAQIRDLESKLAQCAAECEAEAEKASDAALERAAKRLQRNSDRYYAAATRLAPDEDRRRDGALESAAGLRIAARMVRALKRGGA